MIDIEATLRGIVPERGAKYIWPAGGRVEVIGSGISNGVIVVRFQREVTGSGRHKKPNNHMSLPLSEFIRKTSTKIR